MKQFEEFVKAQGISLLFNTGIIAVGSFLFWELPSLDFAIYMLRASLVFGIYLYIRRWVWQ